MSVEAPFIAGVDFSEPSRRAVEVARAICARTAAPLVLLHAWNADRLPGSGRSHPQLESWIAEHRAELANRLEGWAGRARTGGVRVSSRVVEGVASRVLPAEAHSARARAVIVGRHGSADLPHVLLGSVSERVVHQSPCPVLVVPTPTTASILPERLLIGIDFSQASKDACHVALRFAQALRPARGLLVVHVRDAPGEWAYRGEYLYDRDSLERWASLPADAGVEVEFTILAGRTEERLVSAAARERCDWLVLGLQGRSALAAFLIGSTTDRTLKLSDRPVLVVPAISEAPGESAG